MSRITQLSLVLACLGTAGPAYAHFHLTTPTNWAKQSDAGDPQKTAPCGNEGSPADLGVITEYKAGDTISISITETTYHPGHYRVSLAADQASLPHDPDGDVVKGTMACGSLAINPNPTLPLLADGLLVHNAMFTSPQTMQVTLPPGMTCDHCVLQVVEFMAEHGAPCFYHHCANIKISATGADAGTQGPAGVDAGTGTSSGGGCDTGGGLFTGSSLLMLTIGFVVLRRRSA